MKHKGCETDTNGSEQSKVLKSCKSDDDYKHVGL